MKIWNICTYINNDEEMIVKKKYNINEEIYNEREETNINEDIDWRKIIEEYERMILLIYSVLMMYVWRIDNVVIKWWWWLN